MRLLLAVLALLLFADTADAQFRRHRGIAERGDLAVAIGFSGLSNFVLNPIEGGVGLRYRAADQTVLGAAVSIGGSDSSTEYEDEFSGQTVTSTRTEESDSRSASLALWVEQHLGKRRSTVSPFVGAAIRVATGSGDSRIESVRTCPAEGPGCSSRRDGETQEIENTSFGGGLILGGEVKIVNGVTLSGAYTIGADYVEQDTRRVQLSEVDGQEDQETEVDSHTEGWRYGVGTTQVALSIYF